jgi:hypothetical protein
MENKPEKHLMRILKLVDTWERSSFKKLKTRSQETGSQMEVAALRTTPLGWPGSELRWTVTSTLSLSTPEMAVHLCICEALKLAQKLLTIFCDSFIMLLLPSGVTANHKSRKI